MYILHVLVEHPIHRLDAGFDYLSDQKVQAGCRVKIPFARQHIVGYVDDCKETQQTKQQLEQARGFKMHYIEEIIDDKPLLNDELMNLATYVSKLTLAPRIAVLQAMLPKQLKPSSSKGVGIRYQRVVQFLNDFPAKTKKQEEAKYYIKEYPGLKVSDYPYSQALLDKLVEQGIIEYQQVEVFRDPYQESEHHQKEIVLTHDQKQVINHIRQYFDQYKTILLHGVTGSGKTEVYLQLASEVVKRHQSVLVMVPEISLTPMMVRAFKERFFDAVAIIHSKLSPGERYDEYRRIASGEVKIVVGARSAVFAPLQNIGLMILDEEHDSSYKQESTPRYQTAQIAKYRAQHFSCPLVLGSATPSLESYSRAKQGVYDLCQLPQRINQNPLPHIDIIDMAKEMKNHNYSMFSRAMKEEVQKRLDKQEQVILLLNKRGYASYMQCLQCGEVIKCPHCDVTLTYHKASHSLKCHYCDYMMPVINQCPHCQSHDIKMVGYGTQKIEELVAKEFDNARVLRYDVDTTRNKRGHQTILEQFERQEANILVGTQMIAKGLDFPNVTFVGVLNADMSLNVPDFRSQERTYQLLEQVSGRSGRGDKTGTVMIQTYNPHHFVMECVKDHDYQRFYQAEMKQRQLGQYPPFVHIISIVIEGKKEEDVESASQDIAHYLKQHCHLDKILGPAPCQIYRMNDYYRQRLMIKTKQSPNIYPILKNILDSYDKNTRKVRVICDFNPYTMM